MMLRRLQKDVLRAGLSVAPGRAGLVGEADIESLPVAAQRYLRFMGVVGRPRDGSFLLGWTGRYRLGVTQPWLRCEAWQYNTSLDVARFFHLRLRAGGVVPILASDSYVGGHGHLLAQLLGFLTVVDGHGEPLDLGELVSWLNDAVFFAPSMLLDAGVVWHGVDDAAFDLSLTDRGHTVTARVFLDRRGAPCDFSTNHRAVYDLYDPARALARTEAEWSTPIDEWDRSGDRPRPAHGQAVWHLPEGSFVYADMRVTALVRDVPPGQWPVANLPARLTA